MVTIDMIKHFNPEVQFKSCYKHRMTYEGKCGDHKFELEVYDYRWEFEPVESSAELIEMADDCTLRNVG